MLNTPESYIEAGQKAAKARNERDEARAKFHADWFRRARSLEQDGHRQTANELYQTAYRATRRI